MPVEGHLTKQKHNMSRSKLALYAEGRTGRREAIEHGRVWLHEAGHGCGRRIDDRRNDIVNRRDKRFRTGHTRARAGHCGEPTGGIV